MDKQFNKSELNLNGKTRQQSKHGAYPQTTHDSVQEPRARHSLKHKKGLHARVRDGLKKAFPASQKSNTAPQPKSANEQML